MGLFLFGAARSGKKQRSEAVIDIGSHSIKALVYETPDGRNAAEAPRVLKKIADRLPLGAEQLRAVTKLHELMFLLVRQMGGSPGKVTIAVGPHLADYSLASWPARDAVRESMVLGSDLARMFQDVKKSREDADRTLWVYPTAVFANGYLMQRGKAGAASPIRFLQKPRLGQSASLSFGVLIASLPKRVAEALEEARFAWGGMPIEFIPLPLAYSDALANIGEAPDYLIIDVGGEETTLARVHGGTLQSVSFFPVGSHEFIRAAAKDENVSFREAEDMALGYSRATVRSAHGAGKTDAAGATERAVGTWTDSLIRALNDDYRLGPLGDRVILTGGGAKLPEVEAAVRGGEWMRKFSHVSAPSVRILAGDGFFHGASLGGAVQGPEDAGLAALTHYALHHNDFFL